MADLYSTRATSALNEKDYINKLYDASLGAQKDTIQQGYDQSIQQLNSSQQATKQQTSDYLKRAYVEGQRASGHVEKPNIIQGTAGADAQARLTMGNRNQANRSTLASAQSAADAEYQRQRQLKADWYSSQIKQAQADNDMNRAQALYDAAKAEEEQLRSLRQQGATLMAGKGDNSILDQIARGEAVTIDETTPTDSAVLKNEAAINKIYDAQIESQRAAAQYQLQKDLSDIDAKQQAATRETDKNLTSAYVNALQKARNYQEVQNAYGQGSGAAMQARLARESGLAQKLTDLRALQIGKDAQYEGKRLDAVSADADTIAKAIAAANLKRNQELYAAAEKEEQNLVNDQTIVGQQLAKNGDYSVLGKLYGLTPAQIAALMPSSGGGGGGGRELTGIPFLDYGRKPGSSGGSSTGSSGGSSNSGKVPVPSPFPNSFTNPYQPFKKGR